MSVESDLKDLYLSLSECRGCRLAAEGTHPVPGYGNTNSPILFVAEAPGEQENKEGRPFVGKAGKELRKLVSSIGLDLDSLYRSNRVKCWPGPGNPTPKPDICEACGYWLDGEIAIMEPRIIVAMGATAINHFLPGAMVGDCHGSVRDMGDYILLPTYHPAAALHHPAHMKAIMADFALIPGLIRGELPEPTEVEDSYPNPSYHQLEGTLLGLPETTIAIDTETDRSGRLWCLSLSYMPGTGFVVMREDLPSIEHIFHPPYTLVFHNATFDLKVLAEAGIHPTAPIHDTMLMAHVLEEDRLSLKILSRKYLGIAMVDYDDVVGPYQQPLSIQYLEMVSDPDRVWPDPEPTETIDWDRVTGTLRVKTHNPQNIHRKSIKILSDSATKGADAYARWHSIYKDERSTVEAVLGPMPRASIEDVDRDSALVYSARDADSTLRLYYYLKPKLEAEGLWSVYDQVDRPIIPMVAAMMRNGMPLSMKSLNRLRPGLVNSRDRAFLDAAVAAERPFNPNSSDQVAAIIHGQFGVPVKYKTDTGKASTKDDALAVYKAEAPIDSRLVQVIDAVLEYRKYSHLIDSFLEPLSQQIVAGRIHCDLKLTGTSTGRLASARPNLQNIPVRDKEGKWLRDCFQSRPGWSLLSLDASQIELRVAAHLSQDPMLLKAYRADGTDLHSETAQAMFGRTDGIWRYIGKTLNFAILYGISAEGLYKQIIQEDPTGHWTIPICQGYLDRYFATHPGITRYISDTHSHLRRTGYVLDMFGGRRSIPKVYAASRSLVSDALREAGNMPVQGSAARIIKVMMARVWGWLESPDCPACHVVPLLQIHDDLVFEVEDSMLVQVARSIKSVMEGAIAISVPLKVTAKSGKTWGNLKDLDTGDGYA